MLGSMLSGFMLALNLLSRGGNNVWIPSNVRSLGCYSPFDLQAVVTNGAGSNEIGFSACFMCYTNFILIRGVQCMCIDDRTVNELIPVDKTYCDIVCDEISQPSNNETFMCGGNLGANFYCNGQAGSICLDADSNQSAVKIYRDFDANDEDGFQSMVPCLDFGCGRPETKDRINLVYAEYFPNLTPEDCIIYCTYVKTSYAHAGWISSNNQLYPTCACSNATRQPYPTDPPCVEGTCPPPLNPIRFIAGDANSRQSQSCGNLDAAYPNWSVFCTTTVVSPVNGTPYCAAFQTPYNSSWDVCPVSATSTQKTSSLSLTTPATQNIKCQSRNKSQFKDVPRRQWGGIFVGNGNCANNSRLYNGSCYYTASLSDNDMEDVDDWRKASAKYCNEMYDGHLLAIETEDEKNFIAGEFLLSDLGEDGTMRPYLTSGIKTNASTEYWNLPNDVQIEITNVSNWGVELVNCADDYPSYLILYYEMETQGYDSWQFTRDESSRHFVCEYIEPEDIQTTSTSTTTMSTSTSTTTSTSTSTTTPTTTSTTTSTTTTSTTTPTTTTSTTTPTTTSTTTPTTTITSTTPTTSTSTTIPTTAISTTTPTTSTTTIAPTTSPSTLSLTPISSTVSTLVTSSTTPASSSTEEMTEESDISSSTFASTSDKIPLSTTKPTLVPESNHKSCPCAATDMYHVNWTIRANTTKTQACRPGASGMASWSCDLIANQCSLRTKQPNFEGCQSEELEDIAEDIADYDTELNTVWENLLNFTQPNDTYFGHEIDYILGLVTDLLDRQDEQMNDTINHLEFQINTTLSGVNILNNLISHTLQWEQLDQGNRSQSALLLLNVSEDMSFRLADVAEMDNLSLRCEIRLTNLTFSSSYWDGGPKEVYDCYMNAIMASEVFLQFPSQSQFNADSTYLLLPEEAVAVGRRHKAAGLLISHSILQHLLPGQNSVAGDQKQINSPLISYSLRNDETDEEKVSKNTNIPEGTFVQFVYQHAEEAKDPPVRILHRDLDPGETPSPVIGSAFCAFLSYHGSSSNRTVWIWDGQGCTLESTNRTHTLCKCNHLTGFSTLMDFHEYTGESRPLEITSFACSLASAISLAITFTVLTVLRSIKTDRTIITQNLCIFLMISHILALTTLDRHYLKLDDVTCAIMGVLLHFSLLVSFMWMGIEGVRLCRMVVYVFNLCDWTFYYVLAANLVPFFIVGTTLLVAQFTTGIIPAYTGDETCWLNGENYKWSFAGPIAVIIIGNVVFAIIAVRSSWNLKQNMDRSIEEKIRNAAALSLSLTCLLGISWLSGFLLYTETLVFAYIFTITNGLQGVTIMLFRCVLNDEVRNAIKERWRRHRDNRMGRWSSTMTNNTNSQRRPSVVGTGSKSGTNRKLTQTNSRLSNLSNVTKTTETTIVPNNRLPERMQRKNLRTFSGSEFSETEYSSGARGSFSSTGSYLPNISEKQEPTVNNGVRESRRVSFLIQDPTLPSTSLSSSGFYQVNPNNLSDSTSVVSRRPGHLMFLEQDPSAFF